MLLVDNLRDEGGCLDHNEINKLKTIGIREEWVQGIPHPQLFNQFKTAVKADINIPLSDDVMIWRELFYSVLSQATPTEAIGAMGIGTESKV